MMESEVKTKEDLKQFLKELFVKNRIMVFCKNKKDFIEKFKILVNKVQIWNSFSDVLPSENKQYLCKVKSAIGGLVHYRCLIWNTEYHEWIDDHGELVPDDIISWSEIKE